MHFLGNDADLDHEYISEILDHAECELIHVIAFCYNLMKVLDQSFLVIPNDLLNQRMIHIDIYNTKYL